jgi:hypothetical protein
MHLVEGFDHGDLVLGGGHDEFADALVRDVVLFTVLVHETRSLHAQPRHGRAGHIVHTRMDHTAVVACMGGKDVSEDARNGSSRDRCYDSAKHTGLVVGDLALLLHDGDTHVREAVEDLARSGHAHDAATNNAHIVHLPAALQRLQRGGLSGALGRGLEAKARAKGHATDCRSETHKHPCECLYTRK